jgi:hypothetical protein
VVCHARPLRHCQDPIEFNDTICDQRLPNEKFCHRIEVPGEVEDCQRMSRSNEVLSDNVSLPRPGSDGSQARAAHTVQKVLDMRQMRAADVRLT